MNASRGTRISGSSPRMRGTPYTDGADLNQLGIIPAHAGNTPAAVREHGRLQDHPRACGEHSSHVHVRRAFAGSSPRMRGTHRRHPPAHPRPGIIPAHAGNTRGFQWRRIPWGGSSPRMRGTHVAAHHHEIRLGIIPAHAGNTTTCQSSHPARRWIIPAHAGNTRRCRRIPLRFRDHPRACGEHRPMSFPFY